MHAHRLHLFDAPGKAKLIATGNDILEFLAASRDEFVTDIDKFLAMRVRRITRNVSTPMWILAFFINVEYLLVALN